jgi:hypothetical protein
MAQVNYTLYKAWAEGKIGNFGKFQTEIFKAYGLADFANEKLLQSIYPNWFVKDCGMRF